MSDVIPLFSVVIDEEEKKIFPVIKDAAGRKAKSEQKVIADISKKIEDDSRALAAGQEGGLTTVGGYVLLETLHRLGLSEQLNAIKQNIMLLQQASLFCAIGILAGREIPEGITFETKYASSGIDLRGFSNPEDLEAD